MFGWCCATQIMLIRVSANIMRVLLTSTDTDEQTALDHATVHAYMCKANHMRWSVSLFDISLVEQIFVAIFFSSTSKPLTSSTSLWIKSHYTSCPCPCCNAGKLCAPTESHVTGLAATFSTSGNRLRCSCLQSASRLSFSLLMTHKYCLSPGSCTTHSGAGTSVVRTRVNKPNINMEGYVWQRSYSRASTSFHSPLWCPS